MDVSLKPIAFVANKRKEIVDDNWGDIISEIKLDKNILESSLNGIESFSHLSIIFYMNQVEDKKAVAQYRHPRNNENLPKVGTFAQRNKNRPNKIGLTIVKIIKREKDSIFVTGLDAIDSTPILDIKPVMEEFLPKEKVSQPDWTKEIMKNYW